MIKTFIILTTLVLLVACYSSDTPEAISGTKVATKSGMAKNKSERKKLIVALKMLRKTLVSNDKETIAGIFDFPLSDDLFSIYIDEETYSEQFKSNGNKMTRSMFIQYYEEIAESIWLLQLNNLLHNTSVDSLLYKDTLGYQAYILTEPCFYSYHIEVIKNTVTLRVDMNSNRNYRRKVLSQGDILENSSEICEHSLWWTFKFDGNKLHLKSISGAG